MIPSSVLPSPSSLFPPPSPFAQFFTELSQRGNNPIYNILPDTLSCLSKLAREAADGMGPAAGGNVVVGGAPASSVVRPFDAATFRETVRFLLSFINKD